MASIDLFLSFLHIFSTDDVSQMDKYRERKLPASDRRVAITRHRIQRIESDSVSYLVHKIILWDKTVLHLS